MVRMNHHFQNGGRGICVCIVWTKSGAQSNQNVNDSYCVCVCVCTCEYAWALVFIIILNEYCYHMFRFSGILALASTSQNEQSKFIHTAHEYIYIYSLNEWHHLLNIGFHFFSSSSFSFFCSWIVLCFFVHSIFFFRNLYSISFLRAY